MIKFSALYPNTEGATFDFGYYQSTHWPLTLQLLGASILRAELERGVAGAGGSRPPYIAAGHRYFDSMESFRQAFVPHLERFRADIPNFTNVAPLVQVSEVDA